MTAGTPRTGLRRSPHFLLAILSAVALFLTMGLAGSAIADENETTTTTNTTDVTETATPAEESVTTDDAPSSDPIPSDPVKDTDESTSAPTSPSSSTATTSSPTTSSPTSTTPSGQPGDQTEPADDLNGLGPTEGVLAVRVINSVDGSEVVNVGARISKPHDSRFTRLPASMVLEAGEYYVDVMDVPAGYSSVAPMSRTATVVAKKRLTITLVATPVSGPTQSNHPHPVTPTVRPERIPIKSIPSGRTS